MKRRNQIPFYVIVDNVNRQDFERYDVMPYLVRCYDDTKKANRPKTYEEFKAFVESNSAYMYWARCEWELCLSGWISKTKTTKIDVHYQIMMNIDVVVNLLMENLGINGKDK